MLEKLTKFERGYSRSLL